MEEVRPVEPSPTQTPNPSTATQPIPPQSKKRRLDNVNIQNSQYFKMRAVLNDLRPHFIEVLKTPDFRNCTAAEEIRQQLKVLMELYRQMTADTVNLVKCKSLDDKQPLPARNTAGERTAERPPEVAKSPELPPESQSVKRPEEKPFTSGSNSVKGQDEDSKAKGSYVVGGSAFGWNFITFPGGKMTYYGVSKETFRSANPL